MKYSPVTGPCAAGSSPPARGRGLKSRIRHTAAIAPIVAPCAGAWIEISTDAHISTCPVVAPCAGAWIEIYGALEHSAES